MTSPFAVFWGVPDKAGDKNDDDDQSYAMVTVMVRIQLEPIWTGL